MIELRRISILDKNMRECIELEVLDHQKEFVASNAESLADEFDTNKASNRNGKGDTAVAYAACHDGRMVGFAMYAYFPPGEYSNDEHCYYFWRLMVDRRHQGKGIGRRIVSLVMEEIKTKPMGDAKYCYVSYDPKNDGSRALFKSHGFVEDGRVIDGETVARCLIS